MGLGDVFRKRKADGQIEAGGRGHLPTQDAQAAIEELSRAVRDNPKAVEIWLALGNLYRSQGEIERAIQIRYSLTTRRDLSPSFQARAWYELGRDFRRGGFLDRSQKALSKALELGFDREPALREMAQLSGESGGFEDASRIWAELSRPVEEAHFLVRAAREKFAGGEEAAGRELLDRALTVHPGSPEAWLERLLAAWEAGDLDRFREVLARGLAQVEPSMRLALPEGLLEAAGTRGAALAPAFAAAACEVLAASDPDVALCHLAATIALRAGHPSEARPWLEKALLLAPDFWPARLELFDLARDEQTLTPFFRSQLDYFIGKARRVKRFVCSFCGLKRERLFFQCPRCRTWHSMAFRRDLND